MLRSFVVCWALMAVPAMLSAQHEGTEHDGSPRPTSLTAGPHRHGAASDGWEGSSAGIAYSERNHHIAGLFVLLMGLAELGHALRLTSFRWTTFLLPLALTGTGLFLTIWSDHEAWPVGSLGFAQTFFGQDHEIVQHKIYGLLALAVGTIELIRRLGLMGHAAWTTPLPVMAILGGLMLFGHSHGDHPSAHKIALHHALMGTMALTAGSSKLLAGWFLGWSPLLSSKWEFLWAGLILLIGAQLLIYSE